MAVLLIRHGETDLNAARVVQFPDTPLGAEGKRQALRLGQRLAGGGVELVLTSDYQRARTTAEAVAESVGSSLIESHHLRERNFGEIRGRAYSEFADIDIFDPAYHPPGGESWHAFNARVDTAWNEIIAHARALSGDLAVVTHGLVLRSLIERKLDLSDHVAEMDWVVANTSVTTVEPVPPWRVVEFASVEHLAGGGSDVAPV